MVSFKCKEKADKHCIYTKKIITHFGLIDQPLIHPYFGMSRLRMEVGRSWLAMVP